VRERERERHTHTHTHTKQKTKFAEETLVLLHLPACSALLEAMWVSFSMSVVPAAAAAILPFLSSAAESLLSLAREGGGGCWVLRSPLLSWSSDVLPIARSHHKENCTWPRPYIFLSFYNGVRK